MTANDSKPYLGYLNKLVDERNNSYYCSICKNPIHSDYSEEFEPSHKAPKFKAGDCVKITMYKNIFSKGYTGKWSNEAFVIDYVLKTNHWTYEIKDLNKEKIMRRFSKKKCCWVNYKWVIIQNQIVILVIKQWNNNLGVDTNNAAAKTNFIALKAEVDKPNINTLVNLLSSLNNLRTKVDALDVDKLKSVSLNLKKSNWCSE